MGVGDAVSYTWRAISAMPSYLGLQPKMEIRMPPPPVPVPLWKIAASSGPYVRLAGLSGMLAVILGAYGSHRQYPECKKGAQDQKQVFETASRYHFIHTLALLGMPLCRAHYLAGTIMLSAMVMFCGSCYYYAFTGDKRFSKITPIGGICFILGWLSMCL